MKQIVYCLLLFILFGCSSKSPLQQNRVRLEFRDSVSHEYYLLSVRDSGLVVMPGYYNLKGPSQFISFSKINCAYYHTGGKTSGTWIGGLTGFGAVFAALIAYVEIKHIDIGGGEGFAVGGAVISLPAIVVGMITGYLVSSDEDRFDLSKAHDRDALREVAIFPYTEPPELQKIK